MKTYPLNSISLEEAKQLQFHIVDTITKHFDGFEVLSTGDVGVVLGQNKPNYTRKVEAVFAEIFGAEAAVLVRGSGSGAIRLGLQSFMKSGGQILVHKAPVYPTTQNIFELMGLSTVEADFNNIDEIIRVINDNPSLNGVIVQQTRQKPDDSYDFAEVIQGIKAARSDLPILTDDNYAVFKTRHIGCQCGADLATFSAFKTLGPEGVGVIIGRRELIDRINALNYSGGSQVQGHEAMDTMRSIIYAPVALAIQSEVGEELVLRLNAGELPRVKGAFLANAQSKVLLVEFDSEIADAVLEQTAKLGAAAYPVGSESRYEFVPMMYRISGTFRAADPTLEKRMIRINPMRSGADTVIRILSTAISRL